uniref:Uncharacterized protein n=1 Tax=Siphoviridae sp. ctQLz13 TaxID=2825492 RepID=A0A8S5NUJ1_9CAUD|nr:MAG TPA: hypothetical protein [Siphoviridae sp. ctQLz13]
MLLCITRTANLLKCFKNQFLSWFLCLLFCVRFDMMKLLFRLF